jgi:Leucine-rich repeat (LRR) protein
VNLKWLDLSFNLIEKIEGLDKLTKLTDLSLFSNNITVLSGLENLHELNILSVGQNQITEHTEAIRYLFSLNNKLQVLKMADNPFFKNKEAEYRQFAIAFLGSLKYLDYELIDEESREKAVEKHKEELQEYEVQKNQEINEEQEKQTDPALKDAKIECTI